MYRLLDTVAVCQYLWIIIKVIQASSCHKVRLSYNYHDSFYFAINVFNDLAHVVLG